MTKVGNWVWMGGGGGGVVCLTRLTALPHNLRLVLSFIVALSLPSTIGCCPCEVAGAEGDGI